MLQGGIAQKSKSQTLGVFEQDLLSILPNQVDLGLAEDTKLGAVEIENRIDILSTHLSQDITGSQDDL